MELRTDCPLCKDLHHNCFVEQTTIEEKPFESFICFQRNCSSEFYRQNMNVFRMNIPKS